MTLSTPLSLVLGQVQHAAAALAEHGTVLGKNIKIKTVLGVVQGRTIELQQELGVPVGRKWRSRFIPSMSIRSPSRGEKDHIRVIRMIRGGHWRFEQIATWPEAIVSSVGGSAAASSLLGGGMRSRSDNRW